MDFDDLVSEGFGPDTYLVTMAAITHFTTVAGNISYPILQSELDVLQNRHLQRGMRGFRSIPIHRKSLRRVADEFLENMNDNRRLTKHVRESFAATSVRIHQLLWNFGRSTFWSPDIVFKVFNDLDIMFFNGVLYHRIYLRWVEHTPRGEIAETRGPIPFVRPRTRMTLYWDSIRGAHATLSTLLGHLLHEMLHAYLMILTRGDDEEGGRHEYHGSCFRKCADAIARTFNGEISIMEEDER